MHCLGTDWLDTVYFPTLQKRLSILYKAACAKLSDMGVPVHPSKAGIFIWADFSSVSTVQCVCVGGGGSVCGREVGAVCVCVHACMCACMRVHACSVCVRIPGVCVGGGGG